MAQTSDIVRGSTFKRETQIGGSDLILADGTPNPIVSTTADNPAKINTRYPHGLSNGAKIYIRGIHGNWIICGNQVATVTTATQFTVPVTGQAATTTETGYITATTDATSITVTLSLVSYPGGANITGITVSITWIDQAIFQFYAGITAAMTALIDPTLKEVYLKIHQVDGAGAITDDFILYTVGNS